MGPVGRDTKCNTFQSRFSQAEGVSNLSQNFHLEESCVSQEWNCISITAVPSHWWGEDFGKGDRAAKV